MKGEEMGVTEELCFADPVSYAFKNFWTMHNGCTILFYKTVRKNITNKGYKYLFRWINFHGKRMVYKSHDDSKYLLNDSLI